MTQLLNCFRLTRKESPVAIVVLPLATFVFLMTLFGYLALTIVV